MFLISTEIKLHLTKARTWPRLSLPIFMGQQRQVYICCWSTAPEMLKWISDIQALLSGATMIQEPHQGSPKSVCTVKEPKLPEMNLQQDHQPARGIYPTGQGSQAQGFQ